jgi:predicted RNA-binding Zn ribbon-like protein
MGDWVWDGGRPCLDLVNTIRDRRLGGRETLHTPEELATWLRAAGLPGDPDEADLRAARRLREAIDRLAFPSASAADRGAAIPETEPLTVQEAVEVINAAVAAVPPVPRLTLDGGGHPVAAPREKSTAAALGRLAVDAIELLTGDDLLRVCAATDCGVRFVDRSPAGNRQWCSMRRCGNRTKARRHYDRTRS